MEFNALTRRQAVQTIASAFTPLTAPVRVSADTESRNQLFDLWQVRMRLIGECRLLDQRWLEARARLPSWCRIGPKYLSQNGLEIGPEVGWPRNDEIAIRLADGRSVIRPSPADLRQLLQEDTRNVSREQATCLYQSRVQHLRSRLRERRELFSREGMPRSVDWHRLERRIELVERDINGLSSCADVTAAKLIIMLEAELDGIPNPMIMQVAWNGLDTLGQCISDYLAARVQKLRRLTLAKHG